MSESEKQCPLCYGPVEKLETITFRHVYFRWCICNCAQKGERVYVFAPRFRLVSSQKSISTMEQTIVSLFRRGWSKDFHGTERYVQVESKCSICSNPSPMSLVQYFNDETGDDFMYMMQGCGRHPEDPRLFVQIICPPDHQLASPDMRHRLLSLAHSYRNDVSDTLH